MKFNLSLCAALFLFYSCQKKQEINSDLAAKDSLLVVPDSHEPVESSTVAACYLGVTGKDSVFVSLDDNLGTIIGKMKYKNFEKDSSFGDLMGSKNGDTLKLTYNFQSEGKQSEREIFFLQKDGKLFEGIGDYATEGNTDSYSNPKKVKFDGRAFQQIDCEVVQKNLK